VAHGAVLVSTAEALLEYRAGEHVAQLRLDDGSRARQLDVFDAHDGQQLAVHLEHRPVSEIVR